MKEVVNPTYINEPISNPEEDSLGISVYCEKIKDVLEKGAKMIAVTSSFGAGKSSIIKMLASDSEYNKERQIVIISMWPKICDNDDKLGSFADKKQKNDVKDNSNDFKDNSKSIDSNELHSFLIYQIAENIGLSNKEYIKDKINTNLGSIRVNTESVCRKILLGLGIAFLLLIFFINNTDIEKIFGIDSVLCRDFVLILAIVIFAYLIINSEIIFSSQKSEGNKKLMPYQILDIYNKYILSSNKKRKYLIVIEDLDRSGNKELVAMFIKELRKYYVENKDNRIAYLVNIKPESEIINDYVDDVDYLKLFDYIIDLPKINIINYDSILDNLLKSQSKEIKHLLNIDNPSLENMPQMEWIIRGKKLNIRKIKDRLNKTFMLYENLKNRFSNVIGHDIKLEKCAAAVYLKTEYEVEFLATPDDGFDKLVNNKINKEAIGEIEFNDILKSNREINVKDYNKAVKELVSANLIDFDYREFYYNYPKNARIYKTYEKRVMDAILYDENYPEISKDIEMCENNDSTIFEEAFKRVDRLGIPVKKQVVSNERLLLKAFKYAPSKVYMYVENINYAKVEDASFIEEMIEIVRNCVNSEKYRTEIIDKYIEIWINNCSVEQINALREELCKIDKVDIERYKKLFDVPYSLITRNEIGILDLDSDIYLINVRSKGFSNEIVDMILKKVNESKKQLTDLQIQSIINLINKVKAENEAFVSSYDLILFMELNNKLVPEYEKLIIEDCKMNGEINDKYVNLVNKRMENGSISEQTLENIYEIDKYKGYSKKVSNKLYNNGYYYDSVLVNLSNDYEFDLLDSKIVESLINDVSHFYSKHPDLFEKSRELIINNGKFFLENYKVFFSNEYKIITIDQLSRIIKSLGIKESINYINQKEIDEAFINSLVSELNTLSPADEDVFAVIQMIASLPQSLIKIGFELLDLFDKYSYSKLNLDQIKQLREHFKVVYNLNTASGMMTYSDKTFYLDEVLDKNIATYINNAVKATDYVDLINKVNIKSITSVTIDNISKIGNYPYNEKINEMLLKNEAYEKYVISRVLKSNCFEIEDDKEDELWGTYIDVFNKSKDEIYQYMLSNKDFLLKIIKKGSYHDLSNEKLLVLSSVYQDYKILKYIEKNKDENFVIDYLSRISGFLDTYAANTAVDIIGSKAVWALNDAVYNNVYEKLISSGLKGKYTKYQNYHRNKAKE